MQPNQHPLDYKQALHAAVASSKNIDELILILQTISFDENKMAQIKHIMNEQIDALDIESTNCCYFNSLSIDQIFPDDITQLILSFDGSYHTKSVNKKFKQLSEKNEKLEIIKINNSMNNKKRREFKYDGETKKTWSIGAMHDIQNTINQCQSGDRLLIHNGTYEVQHRLSIDKDIQLIGVQSNVLIIINDTDNTDNTDNDNYFCRISCNVYLKNINIKTVHHKHHKHHKTGIVVANNCKLWMDNVELSSNNGIEINDNASLYVTNCDFIGSNKDNKDKAAKISIFAKEIYFEKNKFKYEHAEDGCISLMDYTTTESQINASDWVHFNFIDNVFEGNFISPVAWYSNKIEVEQDVHYNRYINTDRYVLKGNVCNKFQGGDLEDVNQLSWI